VDVVPEGLEESLLNFTESGFRVISCGYRTLDANTVIKDLDRARLEKELVFAGVVVFENKLKPETHGVIQELNAANMRTIMATGDNLLTAVFVAKECEIFDTQRTLYYLKREHGNDCGLAYI
jgi:cation-transporting ATPase 13A3/4/5